MSSPDPQQHRHERIWQLLPWYANATLAAAERSEVEEHLATCPRCTEELAHCRSLGGALRAREDVAPTPHPIQLARLMERIDAHEGRAAARLPPARPRRESAAVAVSTLLADTPRAVRFVLAGQLAALLLLAAAFGISPWHLQRPVKAEANQAAGPKAAAPAAAGRELYRTLSAPSDSEAGAAGAQRPRIRIVFADAATERQIRHVLRRVDGRLVDGPSPLGTYTLETSPRTTGGERSAAAPEDSPAWVLAYLRAQSIVRFAEPVAGAPATGSPVIAPPPPAVVSP